MNRALHLSYRYGRMLMLTEACVSLPFVIDSQYSKIAEINEKYGMAFYKQIIDTGKLSARSSKDFFFV